MATEVAPKGWSNIKAYYGWNEDVPADLDRWEAQMVLVVPPAPLLFGGRKVRGVRVHHRLSGVLRETYQAAYDAGLWDLLQVYDGAYNFRVKRGAKRLSMHALGAAIDHNAARNGMGVELSVTLFGGTPRGLELVALFEDKGWTWGGRFPTPDAMHFQWGSGY